jgi:hypothetical protein
MVDVSLATSMSVMGQLAVINMYGVIGLNQTEHRLNCVMNFFAHPIDVLHTDRNLSR